MKADLENLILQELKSIHSKLNEHDKEFEFMHSKFDGYDKEFEFMHSKFDGYDKEFGFMHSKFDEHDKEFGFMHSKFDEHDKELRNISKSIAKIEVEHGKKIDTLVDITSSILEKLDSLDKGFESNVKQLNNHSNRIWNLESKVGII